jgi:hypothetical protein
MNQGRRPIEQKRAGGPDLLKTNWHWDREISGVSVVHSELTDSKNLDGEPTNTKQTDRQTFNRWSVGLRGLIHPPPKIFWHKS